MGLGDDVMVTGHLRGMQRRDTRKVRLIMSRPIWSEVFDHNPRVAQPWETGDFQTYETRQRGGLRPYIERKTRERWVWREYEPQVGELYLQPEELRFAAQVSPEIVVEPNIKAIASPNKDWGRARWVKLVDLLRREGFEPTQLGPAGTQALRGARLVITPRFRWAAAVLARAKVAILHEGGMHHAAAAVGTPAVVIYGGYISPRQTGYNFQTSLFTGGEPCGMRVPCKHCADAMARIEPEQVLEEALRLWQSTTIRT